MIYSPSLLGKSHEIPMFHSQNSRFVFKLRIFSGQNRPLFTGIFEAPRDVAPQRGHPERLRGVLREGPRVAQGAGSTAADGKDAGDGVGIRVWIDINRILLGIDRIVIGYWDINGAINGDE